MRGAPAGRVRARVLVVDCHTPAGRGLQAALQAAGFEVVGAVKGTAEIYRHVRDARPDAVVIAADSPARDSLEDLALCARHTPKPIVMFAGHADDDAMRRAAEAGVSFYVAPELSVPSVRSLMQTAMAHFEQRRALRRALDDAHAQMSERRIVDQAKCRLMEREGLSESDAYARLRCTAMERGQRIAELAKEILREG